MDQSASHAALIEEGNAIVQEVKESETSVISSPENVDIAKVKYDAAVRVQALQRGIQTRKAVDSRKRELGWDPSDPSKTRLASGTLSGFAPPPPPRSRPAAVKIQSRQRGITARKKVLEMKQKNVHKQIVPDGPPPGHPHHHNGLRVKPHSPPPGHPHHRDPPGRPAGHAHTHPHTHPQHPKYNADHHAVRKIGTGEKEQAAAVKIQARARGNLQRSKDTEKDPFQVLLDQLKNNDRKLKTVDLSCQALEDVKLKKLAEALRGNRICHSLILSHACMTNEQASVISDGILDNRGLLTIDFSNNLIRDDGVLAIAHAIEKSKMIRILNLNSNKIMDKGASALANCLKMNHSVKTLSLSANSIEDKGCQDIAHSIRLNTVLTALHLAENKIQAQGGEAIAEALSLNTATAETSSLFVGLSEDAADDLSASLQSNNSLTILDLAGNNIENVGARAIGEMLRSNEHVTTIDLRSNRISDGIVDLSKGLRQNKHLLHLDIGGNKIDSSGGVAVANALIHNRTLKTLHVDSCSLGFKGAQQFAVALKMNNQLEHLDMSHNEIGPDGAEAIHDALQHVHNPVLHTLNLSSNKVGVLVAKRIRSGIVSAIPTIHVNVEDNDASGAELQWLHKRAVDATKAAKDKRQSQLKLAEGKMNLSDIVEHAKKGMDLEQVDALNQTVAVETEGGKQVDGMESIEEWNTSRTYASKKIQANFRGRKARKAYMKKKMTKQEKKRAAEDIQRTTRGYQQRKRMTMWRSAAVILQRHMRGLLSQKTFQRMLADLALRKKEHHRRLSQRDTLLNDARFMPSRTMQANIKDVKNGIELGYRSSSQLQYYWKKKLNRLVVEELGEVKDGTAVPAYLRKMIFAIKVKVPGATTEEIFCAASAVQTAAVTGVYRQMAIIEKLFDPQFREEVSLVLQLVDVSSYVERALGGTESNRLSKKLLHLSSVKQTRPITRKNTKFQDQTKVLPNVKVRGPKKRFKRELQSVTTARPITMRTKTRLGVNDMETSRSAKEKLMHHLVVKRSKRDALRIVKERTLEKRGIARSSRVAFLPEPSFGPDRGGTKVLITGRNLAFFEKDIKLFLRGRRLHPKVVVGWESLEVTMPSCVRCGTVPINAIVGATRSNFLNFTFTNDCFGPVQSGLPILPLQYSAHENCTICTEMMHLTEASAPPIATWQGFRETMERVCETVHFRKFKFPGTRCVTDYSIACRILTQSMGDMLVDVMWREWDSSYFFGLLPDKACTLTGRCIPSINSNSDGAN
eukprot:g2862.t1